MKKVLLLIMIFLVSIGTAAQDKQFKEGLKNGRLKGEFYFVKNKKGKGYSLEDMRKYSQEHSYLLGGYTIKEIDRFGDKMTALDEFYFLPKSEYPAYVWEHCNGSYDYASLKEGSCWIPAESKTSFVRVNGVKWSAGLSGASIDGSGFAFWYDEGQKRFYYARGTFNQGMPIGDLIIQRFTPDREKPSNVTLEDYCSTMVGKMHEGMAQFTGNGKIGFVNSNGVVAIAPAYERVVKEFSGGRAEVVLDGKEIIIDMTGKYIDLTANQKQLIAQQKEKERQEELKRQQEAKRQELERKQKEMERQRLAEEDEKNRRRAIAQCQPGDKICYSQDYVHSEYFLWFKAGETNYTMRVVCFVEQNINNGERLQIRVGRVESSNSDHYTTPEIDGIKYNKGDVLWIKPLSNKKWRIQ